MRVGRSEILNSFVGRWERKIDTRWRGEAGRGDRAFALGERPRKAQGRAPRH